MILSHVKNIFAEVEGERETKAGGRPARRRPGATDSAMVVLRDSAQGSETEEPITTPRGGAWGVAFENAASCNSNPAFRSRALCEFPQVGRNHLSGGNSAVGGVEAVRSDQTVRGVDRHSAGRGRPLARRARGSRVNSIVMPFGLRVPAVLLALRPAPHRAGRDRRNRRQVLRLRRCRRATANGARG